MKANTSVIHSHLALVVFMYTYSATSNSSRCRANSSRWFRQWTTEPYIEMGNPVISKTASRTPN